MSLFKSGDTSSPFCNANKGYGMAFPCAQHWGAYSVCPLPFQFLFTGFWNEALLGDHGIFSNAFAPASSKVIFSCVSSKFHLSNSTQPLCVFCLRDGQISVKCSACRARRARDFQLQSCLFRKPRRLHPVPEVASPAADILASLTAQTKASNTRARAGEPGHSL